MRLRLMISFVTVAFALVFPLRAAQKGNAAAPADVLVNFGDPAQLAGAANQVVIPDEATIRQGGTATFVVNGQNHGIAIYPVSKNTTRNDITAQLCPHQPTCANPAFANEDHSIRDGRNHTVIVTGTNPPLQRVDDATDRLLSTSSQLGGVAGAFLTGTSATNTVGTQMQFRFVKAGRYLVICMNRGHLLVNWMFGFVNVEGDENEQ